MAKAYDKKALKMNKRFVEIVRNEVAAKQGDKITSKAEGEEGEEGKDADGKDNEEKEDEDEEDDTFVRPQTRSLDEWLPVENAHRTILSSPQTSPVGKRVGVSMNRSLRDFCEAHVHHMSAAGRKVFSRLLEFDVTGMLVENKATIIKAMKKTAQGESRSHLLHSNLARIGREEELTHMQKCEHLQAIMKT